MSFAAKAEELKEVQKYFISSFRNNVDISTTEEGTSISGGRSFGGIGGGEASGIISCESYTYCF